MKKKILAFAVLIICLSILTGSTLAYFTTKDIARNVITSGGIQAEILEQQLADGILKPYPEEKITILPGTAVSKIVTVRSGQAPAWLRARLTIAVYDAENKKLDIPAEELAKAISLSSPDEKWTLTEGWWYYTDALGNGETSRPLLESVSFSGPNMGNEYQNCTLEILVELQAVQKANNGTTVAEAAGWPEE